MRGIPAIPIPMQVSNFQAWKVLETDRVVESLGIQTYELSAAGCHV